MMDSVQIAQKILDAIQREEIDDEVRELIDSADNYLLKNAEKPDYYDDFIEKTVGDLRNTVNGCVKSRNNEKKKDDLKKYKEGYFNEIVQNANDVVWKTQIDNPEIVVEVSKKDDVYFVECSYPDKGFTLENIYGFCTRGNSDKKSDNGQEGMYGIGIKSLLCFVNELHILSNIKIDIISSDKKLDTVKIDKNEERNVEFTFLSFCFAKGDKHAGFNTDKLVKFIDWIVREKREGNIEQFLLNGEDDQIVFDVRSLFFTELRGNGRNSNNSIKKVVFRKVGDIRERDIVIESKEDIIPFNNSNKMIVKIVRILGETYVLIHYQEEQISIAYEYNVNIQSIKGDRLYSTYFIGTYSNKQPMLDVEMGCLVNTTAINSSRSGLERENEKEPEVLSLIKEKGKDSIRILCTLISMDTDERKNIYIDILCRLLYLFRNFQANKDEEYIPQGVFEKSESIINNCLNKWLVNNKKYVLYKEDGIEDEKVIINRPPDSDEENIRNLYATYKSKFYYVENKEKTDIVLFGDEEYEKLTEGIKILCKYIFEDENNSSWIKGIRFPFIKSIGELIKKRIGGEDFSAIMLFLSKIQDEQEKLNIKQLIARYKVNNYFNYMGRYSSNNIVNWLFDVNIYNDNSYEELCKQYEESYGDLKKMVTGHITESMFYYTVSNGAWYPGKWWYKYESELKEFNGDENQILMLLELIYKKLLPIGYNENGWYQIVTNRRNQFGQNIILYNRSRTTTSWNDRFRFFKIDCLSREMVTFQSFRKARSYIDEYNKKVTDEIFKLTSPFRCSIDKIEYADLEPIMKWFAIYEKIDKIEFYVKTIVELPKENKESDIIRFIKKFIGEDVCVCFNKISVENKGKNFTGFVSNLNPNDNTNRTSIYIKQSQNSNFIVHTVDSSNKNKYLLVYSSVDDEQRIMADILEHLGYGSEVCQYIHNFIQTGNITQLSSKEYKKFISQKKLKYEYPFTYEEYVCKKLEKSLSMNSIYTILSGEMSYDDHCPLCNAIPTLNIKEQDLTLLEKRNSLIAMFVARYKEKDIYIKLLCCKSCFNQYKLTLTSAEIEEKDNIKILKLTQTISDSMRTRNITTDVVLSPDNWEIIRIFNDLL